MMYNSFRNENELIYDADNKHYSKEEIEERETILMMRRKNRYEITVELNETNNYTNARRMMDKRAADMIDNIPGANTFNDALQVAQKFFVEYVELFEGEGLIAEMDSDKRYVDNESRKGVAYFDVNLNYIKEIRIVDNAGNDEYHINFRQWLDTYVMLKAFNLLPATDNK